MYPDSPFANPVGSFQTPVPVPDTDPDTGTLVSICLNPAWLPYIIGCLKQLLLQSTWDTTDMSVLALAQERVFNLIDLFQEGLCEVTPATILRQDPSGCGIQWSTDSGTTWNSIDLAECIANIWDEKLAGAFDDGVLAGPGSQAPIGTGQPHVCYTFEFSLAGNSRWLLPVPIETGDVITISGAVGAWFSGGGFDWRCPSGELYFLGACEPTTFLDTGDPAPTIDHARLLFNYGSVYVDGYNTVITIPSSVGQTNAFLQMNDSDLTDNQGEIHGKIQICKGSCVNSDFTVGMGSWIFDDDPGWSAQPGLWVSGQGVKTVDASLPFSPRTTAAIDLRGLSIVNPTITFKFNVVTLGTNGRLFAGSNLGASSFSISTTGPQTITMPQTGTATRIACELDVSLNATGGEAYITEIDICS